MHVSECSKLPNRTTVTKFLLVGFSGCRGCQLSIFASFLLIYIFTVLENVVIVALVLQDFKLQKPMYIFLGNLSFLEIWYISVTLPNMLANILTGNHEISHGACIAQLFIFTFLGAAECYLLAAMAYDRYVAICNPLRYTMIMQSKRVVALLLCCWLSGLFTPVLPIWFLSQLDFCGPNQVEHYFCDASPLVRLACGDTKSKELVDFIVSVAVLMSSLSVIFISYFCITWTIMKMSSSRGRRKAFSTCTSHLAVVCLFYGSMGFTYMRVGAGSPFSNNMLVSVFYSIVTPTLNPVIYSLRNEDVRVALNKVLKTKSLLRKR
ncbi:olfactory receptor 6Q1-like [Spea bombifrons]|uniref:olfactory receptor 6Q1-like n=1 Tax=Spea bombifrons TaxID=233779 RepID=UPI00234B3C5D|nr:olfactory receptor 6Q1-like [Spea bombifrons]